MEHIGAGDSDRPLQERRHFTGGAYTVLTDRGFARFTKFEETVAALESGEAVADADIVDVARQQADAYLGLYIANTEEAMPYIQNERLERSPGQTGRTESAVADIFTRLK
ncbi:MAG TPA: hypothetical protein VK978_03525, partial [Candidatus Saccharimonadales bacterium]|nr:hypothetical protein [Candidatus Saccharimonadales bacterium]